MNSPRTAGGVGLADISDVLPSREGHELTACHTIADRVVVVSKVILATLPERIVALLLVHAMDAARFAINGPNFA